MDDTGGISVSVTLEIWNPDMTYRYPSMAGEFEGIKFSSIMYGGFAAFTASACRRPWRHYPEFALGNIIQVRSRHQIVWSGRISAPTIDTSDLRIDLEADGPIERLKSRLTLTSLAAGTCSGNWITTNLIGDSDLGYLAGAISDGYRFPTDGQGADFSPATYYADAVEQLNSVNGYRYGFFSPPISCVLRARYFDFAPLSTTPDYYLDMADCQSQIQYTTEGIENYLRVTYSPNGSTYKYFWHPATGPDPASAALYGRRDGRLEVPGVVSRAHAEAVAAIALAWRKTLRPATDIVATRITDVTGATVPLPEVQPGRVLHIRGLNPGEFTLSEAQAVNQLCTWPIVLTEPDLDMGTITLSPGGLSSTMDRIMARMEMRAR